MFILSMPTEVNYILSQLSRLETRTKESSFCASDTVIKPRSEMKVKLTKLTDSKENLQSEPYLIFILGYELERKG